MSDNTNIEWCHRHGTIPATWNITTGCDRHSPGCDLCYALAMARRLKAMGQPKYQNDGDPRTSGPGFGLTLHPDLLATPLKWRKPRTVFVNSMSDLFHRNVPYPFLVQVFAAMAMADQHAFLILTKRPARMRAFLTDRCSCGCGHGPGVHLRSMMSRVGDPHSDLYVPGVDGHEVYHNRPWPLPNVWIGTSVENQRYADSRVPHLVKTPAAVRFLSVEPLLGPVDLSPWLGSGIHQVIVGGESGARARRADLAWFRSLRGQCAAAGVSFFMKQLGTVQAQELGVRGKGDDIADFPADLRIREFPAGPVKAVPAC